MASQITQPAGPRVRPPWAYGNENSIYGTDSKRFEPGQPVSAAFRRGIYLRRCVTLPAERDGRAGRGRKRRAAAAQVLAVGCCPFHFGGGWRLFVRGAHGARLSEPLNAGNTKRRDRVS